MARKRKSNFALGALVAVAVGYVAGVLTAPKSGKETRKELSAAASKAIADSEKKLKKLHAELTKIIKHASGSASRARTKAKQDLSDALTRAERAKQTAGELLSAVREGEADNEDLEKAINEVKEASKHLKKFIASGTKQSTKNTK